VPQVFLFSAPPATTVAGGAEIGRIAVNWSNNFRSKMLGRKSASGAIKELMRKLFLAVVVAVLPTWVAVAQQPSQQPKKSPKSGTLLPVRGNPCAKYGAGFVKVEGSDTCVKLGGNVSVEAGGSARR
jgi:hypothetical protein